MAQGYLRASGAPGAFEIVNSSPAGAMTGSGADMARFMIAHLQNGRYGDNQILRPETVRLMHDARPITPTPPLPGMALGFYHEDRNGLRIIGHAGDTNFFHSELHLLPEENVGLYISMSSGGRDGSAHYVRGELLRRFVDRYYPTPHAPPVAIATAKEHGALMAGTYISTRRFDSTFLRMINVVSPVKVVAAANGDLTVSLFHNLSGGLKVWRETAPFQWREVNGDGRMAAVVKDGRVVAFASDDFPPVFVFRPAPIWVQWAILLQLAVAVLALTAALWPVSAILRWRFQRPRNLPGRERLAYHLSRGGAALDVVYVIGFVVFLDALDKDISILDTGSDPILRFLQFLGLLTIPAALAAGWNAWLAWRRRERGWSSRIGATVIAAAAVVIVGYTFALHILTVGLDY
jgi:hypothetical protein